MYEDIFSNVHLNIIMSTNLQGGVGLSCCRMLIELIRDNRKIVDRITPTQVTTYLYQLHDNKHYVLLNLLGVLCVCEDIAITNNQIQIAKELLEKHKVCRNNNLYV